MKLKKYIKYCASFTDKYICISNHLETFIGRLNTKSRRLVSSKDRGEVCAMGFNCICNVYFLNKTKKSDFKGK